MADYESQHTADTLLKSIWSYGTQTIFYQATAPVDWTLVTGFGDALVGVSDQNNYYNSSEKGGTQTGSWATGSKHSHTNQSIQVSEAQLPAHTHGYFIGKDQANGTGHPFYNYKYYNVSSWNQDYQTQNAGSNQTHEHGQSGETEDEAGTWRPEAVVCAIYKKDIAPAVSNILTHSGVELDHSVFPDDTAMPFYQASAPSNWVVIDGTGDRLIAISDTVNKYRSTDGGNVLSGYLTSHSHVGTDHALSIDEMPRHRHYYPSVYTAPPPDPARAEWGNKAQPARTTQNNPQSGSSGSGTAHSHNLNSNTPAQWIPKASICIICKKDI